MVANRLVSEKSLRSTVTAIFERMGETRDDAIVAADVLVEADLRGIEMQGVSLLLPVQVEEYRAGRIKPQAKWQIVKETPATATVDADRGLVWVLGSKLMKLAIDKARKVGIGAVSMHNGGDAGRIGHYATLAAQEDMIGLVASCQGARAVPTFGSEARLGTNPIALAAPASSEVPFLFDAATTASAMGVLRIAYRDKLPFPPATIAELDGTPILEETQSRPVGEFYLLPLGGDRAHGSQKGYGFGMMAEILATMLSGVLPSFLDRDAGERSFFVAFNIAAFTEPDVFKTNMDRLLRSLRETKPAPGYDRVVYAGLLGHEEAIRRRAGGIPLHEDVVKWFERTAAELTIPRLDFVEC